MAQHSVVLFEQAKKARLATKQMGELQHEVGGRTPMTTLGQGCRGVEVSQVIRDAWAVLAGRLATGGAPGQVTGQDLTRASLSSQESTVWVVAGHAWIHHSAVQDEPEESENLDPEQVARQLCRELAALSEKRNAWVEIETLVSQTGLPEDVVVAAAVYGHVRCWLTYAVQTLMLREEGRSMMSSPLS